MCIRDRMMRALDLDLQMRLAEHGGGLDLESEFRSLFRDAIATGDRGVATRAKIALGLITHADRRPGEAITHFARAIEDNTVTPVTHPEVYLKLAEAHFDSGNSVSAVSVLEDAIGFIERSGDDRLFVRFAASLTSVLADAGQWERAEHLAERARNVNVDDIRIRARLIWASGHLAAAQGRPDQGIDLMRRAIALLSATEDTIGTGRAHLFCSALSLDAGQVEKAKEHLDRAGRLLGAGAGGEVEDAITALGRRAQFAQEPTHAISAAESHDTHHR